MIYIELGQMAIKKEFIIGVVIDRNRAFLLFPWNKRVFYKETDKNAIEIFKEILAVKRSKNGI